MKTANNTPRNVTSNVTERASFSIKADGKAFKILIDGLYADKVQSITREVFTNAYDAHSAAGNPDRPFVVNYPTAFDPVFRVRDYGTGLTHEEVMVLYTTVFQSTKEDTNSEAGKFGLGSKSPFAYTDSFTISAYDGDTKRSYAAMIGEDGVPTMQYMGSTECSEDKGLEVSFPIEASDVRNFQRAMQRVCLGFDIKPDVFGGADNADFPGWSEFTYTHEGTGWKFYDSNAPISGAFVKMGCVLYRIDGDAIDGMSYGDQRLMSHNIIFEVPMGSVEIAVSREALSYGRNEPTSDTIREAVETLNEELFDIFMEEINACETYWDASIAYQKAFSSNLPSSTVDLIRGNTVWNGVKVGNYMTFSYNYNDGVQVSILDGRDLRKNVYRFKNTDRSFEITPNKDTVFFIEDLTISPREKFVPTRLRALVGEEGFKSVVWIKFMDEKAAAPWIISVMEKFDGARFLTAEDLPEVTKNVTTAAASQRSPVEARIVSRYGMDQRVTLTPEQMDDGGFFVPLERNTAVIPLGAASPCVFVNSLRDTHLISGSTMVIAVPKTLWKQFEGDQWVNIYDHFKALAEDPKNIAVITESSARKEVLANGMLRYVWENVEMKSLPNTSPAHAAMEFFDNLRQTPDTKADIPLEVCLNTGVRIDGASVQNSALYKAMAYHEETIINTYPLMSTLKKECSWTKMLDKVTQYVQMCDLANEVTNQSAAIAA